MPRGLQSGGAVIQGYPDQSSVLPGQSVTLRVSTDAPWFRIELYRQGSGLVHVSSSAWLRGVFSEDHRCEDDWSRDGLTPDGRPAAAWAGFELAIAPDAASGVYVAMLVEGDAQQVPRAPLPDTSTADARSGKALFVVRSASPGRSTQLLYKVPLFTYQAYNAIGGFSIYQGHDVHFHRPGGGTGGRPWDDWNVDPFDRSSPRQTFAHWDAKLIAWLEAAGYRVDYVTDLDLHREGLAALSPYALVLSVGHDEYYSAPMRDALEAFVARGGNLACLSGNTCWWRVEFDAGDPLRMLGQQTIHHWSDPQVARPEDALTGVSWRNGGERDTQEIRAGFVLQHTASWPFEGTGAHDGQVLGEDEGLVGYECDGAPYAKGAALPIAAVAGAGTPTSFTILGTADVATFPTPNGNAGATMGMHTDAGTVFTGATTDWPRVVATSQLVAHITKNVIDRLGGNPKGLATLGELRGLVACDGFYSPDDRFRHAIVGTRDGAIHELFFHPSLGHGHARLADLRGLVDVASFYSADDGYRHVIVVRSGGEIWELFYSPQTGLGQAQLATIPGAMRVAAFYSPDDGYRHAIVATRSGELHELFYHPAHGMGDARLGSFPGMVDVGAFYSADDHYRHALVLGGDGSVREVFFHPSTGTGVAPLGIVPGARRISAYWAGNDAFFDRRVQLATRDGVVELRYHPRHGSLRARILHGPVADLGGFATDDDGFRHAIVGREAGGIDELFFRP